MQNTPSELQAGSAFTLVSSYCGGLPPSGGVMSAQVSADFILFPCASEASNLSGTALETAAAQEAVPACESS